jgi:hypothetical protein
MDDQIFRCGFGGILGGTGKKEAWILQAEGIYLARVTCIDEFPGQSLVKTGQSPA